MTDSNTQTMITVKKPDGTTERISLAELKARQVKVAMKTSTPKYPINLGVTTATKRSFDSAPPVGGAPLRACPELVEGMTTSGVANDLPVKKMPAREFGAPIENALKKSGLSPVSTARGSQVDAIESNLSFKVPPQFSNRLRSVIQLRLKDIRSLDETRDLALRSLRDGGLGLTESQADELIKSLDHYAGKSPVLPVAGVPALKKSMSALPMIEPNLEPAIATPFNSFVHQDFSSRISGIRNDSGARPPAKFSKPQMSDIISPPHEMGPLDELHYFTLTDFRRLSDNAVEAANRLGQKFINQKEESIVLYFEALKNWRLSPLFREYIAVVCGAVAKGQKLSTAIGDKTKIQLPEIKALVAMEGNLE